MEYALDDATAVLRQTPATLRALLGALPPVWLDASDGPGTWTPFDVLGHLVHGERADWMPRVEHLLRHGARVPFPPFDREAMFAASQGLTIATLLDTFEQLRAGSLDQLAALHLTDADLDREGLHPAFGSVTVRQHLATWVVHDLTHLAQISRAMAVQYREAVGPWHAYLSILRPR